MKYLLSVLFISISFNLLAQEKDSLKINKPIPLGEVTIVAMKKTNTIKQSQIQTLNKQTLSEAASMLPSVIFSQSGSRNESFVKIRGYGSRSIPVYMDGIPVYIPFDGEIDLGRFQTGDLQNISIQKGFSPMELGANTLGGSINLVSYSPKKPLEAFIEAGFGSGKKWHNGFGFGGKNKSWYYMGSFYHTQQDYFPLSNSYNTNDEQSDKTRDNSFEKDNKYRFKIGYTPNKTDEYTINYSNQSSEKGTPTYTGTDENIRVRYWQWPQWDKQSVYFLSRTKLSSTTNLKVRMYYDTFENTLESFDDNSYSTQTFGYAFTSIYDDYTIGSNAVLNYEASKHLFSFSGHFKQDHHKSKNNDDPSVELSDNTFTLGVDYTYSINENNTLISGLSYHSRKSNKAEEYLFNTDEISDLPESKNNAFNAQLAYKLNLENQQVLQFSVAQKTRFATMKDRYSYRIGRSIPNPDLKNENATHIEASYKKITTKGFQFDTSLYSSFLRDAMEFVYIESSDVEQLQNIGKAHFYGLEMVLRVPITDKGNWQTQYSFIKQENTDNPDIKFTNVPEHNITSILQYDLFKNLKSTLQADYYSQRFSTSYGTTANSFLKLDFGLQYKWNQFTFRAQVNNLLDADYEYTEGYPSAGRTFGLSGRYQI